MQFLKSLLRRLTASDRGVTTTEYAVMLVLVAIAVAAFGSGISDSVTGVFDQLITALTPGP